MKLIAIQLAYFASAVTVGPHPGRWHGDHGKTIHVAADEKIQDAIDSASWGTKIVVAAGNYSEQLLIKKSGIALIGEPGAVLSVPATFTDNDCSGVFGPDTQAGICIAGTGVQMDDYVFEHQKVTSVRRPVKGVSVSGFQVEGFTGANIIALGAEYTRIFDNTLIDGFVYGILTSGSRWTSMTGNVLRSSDPFNSAFIAICMDNFEGVYVSDNDISFYGIGLCIQTTGADIHDNSVSYTCSGAILDPYVKDVKLYKNHISNSYECGELGSYGVAAFGTTNALITGNEIDNIRNDGPSAGIFVSDDPCAEDALSCLVNPGVNVIAKRNKVTGNNLHDNDLDLLLTSTGKGNVFKNNQCTTSDPDGLC